jgi:hypothetical protein
MLDEDGDVREAFPEGFGDCFPGLVDEGFEVGAEHWIGVPGASFSLAPDEWAALIRMPRAK